MYETVKTVGNVEYFYNNDKKLVSRFCDDTINYRVDELDEKVKEQLEKARRVFRYPSKPFIDTCIRFQNETPKKAVNYIKYKLLGTAKYLDVFGPQLEEEIQSKKIGDLEKEINSIKVLCEQILQKL